MEFTIDQEYLEVLNNLRNVVDKVEVDNDKIMREFYQCDESSDDNYEEYLKTCNEILLRSNNVLKKADVSLKVIDSELALVGLINDVRDQEETLTPDDFSYLTEFWDQTKNALESVKVLTSTLQAKVFNKIATICRTPQEVTYKLQFTGHYSDEVTSYHEKITKLLNDVRTLIRSFNNSVRQDLFTNTTFIKRVLVSCDVKAFPLLRLVPDVTEKVSKVCSLLKQWMDRDETYVYDISKQIRETRAEKRKAVRVLINKRQERLQLLNNVDQAQEIFVTNREKLKKIEAELKTVEAQVAQCAQLKKHKTEEKRQKEGIVDFLDISIAQTTKNVSLQLKRSRVMRQLRILEQNLKEVEQELSVLQDDLQTKDDERTVVEEILMENSNNINALQTNLEQFTTAVEKLQSELVALSATMGELEYIQNVKTSPEVMEDFLDRPVSVKLAPSLKMKIQRKHKSRDKVKRR